MAVNELVVVVGAFHQERVGLYTSESGAEDDEEADMAREAFSGHI